MPSEEVPDTDPVLVAAVLVSFTAIGLWIGAQENDFGITTTWVWTAIGLSVTYLLYRLVAAVERDLNERNEKPR